MYVYLITNLINNKKYIGITNNLKRRWFNHCHPSKGREQVISNAIQKYGPNNFKFEVLEENVPLDKIDEKEIYYIQKYDSLTINNHGYNVATGGRYNINPTPMIGVKNGRALLTEEEVQYIKNNRNKPLYVLYDEFSDKIGYEAFKNIYHDKTYKDIRPTVEEYPYNIEYSLQFASKGKLKYDEVVELREQFANQVFWKDAYTEKYQKLYPAEMDFWNIYIGNRYKLVMPEVFTKENLKYQSAISHSGENNGRAKLTKEEVIFIREKFENGELTRKQLQQMYPQVSPATINSILRYDTWKNI